MGKRKNISRSTLIKLIKKRGSIKCEMCENRGDGIVRDFDEISHKDGNPENNSPDNLQLVCHSCHRYYDFFIKAGKKNAESIKLESEILKNEENKLKLPIEQRESQYIFFKQRPPDEYLIEEIKKSRDSLAKLLKEQGEIKDRFFGERFTKWRNGESVPVWWPKKVKMHKRTSHSY
jgi:HNH endonuclease